MVQMVITIEIRMIQTYSQRALQQVTPTGCGDSVGRIQQFQHLGLQASLNFCYCVLFKKLKVYLQIQFFFVFFRGFSFGTTNLKKKAKKFSCRQVFQAKMLWIVIRENTWRLIEKHKSELILFYLKTLKLAKYPPVQNSFKGNDKPLTNAICPQFT